MTDREARMLGKLNLIKCCYITQVNEDEWEIDLYGDEQIDHEDCVVRQFGNSLMTDDLSDTQWFFTIDFAIQHLTELGIKPPIQLRPLWPAELAKIIANRPAE